MCDTVSELAQPGGGVLVQGDPPHLMSAPGQALAMSNSVLANISIFTTVNIHLTSCLQQMTHLLYRI
jgi:hypothetical protein